MVCSVYRWQSNRLQGHEGYKLMAWHLSLPAERDELQIKVELASTFFRTPMTHWSVYVLFHPFQSTPPLSPQPLFCSVEKIEELIILLCGSYWWRTVCVTFARFLNPQRLAVVVCHFVSWRYVINSCYHLASLVLWFKAANVWWREFEFQFKL